VRLKSLGDRRDDHFTMEETLRARLDLRSLIRGKVEFAVQRHNHKASRQY
jgi:hypothetical protein